MSIRKFVQQVRPREQSYKPKLIIVEELLAEEELPKDIMRGLSYEKSDKLSSSLTNNSSLSSSSFVEIDFGSSFTSNHRILDVTMTSGGGAVYTENIANAFSGVNYITSVRFWPLWERSRSTLMRSGSLGRFR